MHRYGIWVLIGSIFQYRMLLSLGLDSAINRYIPVCIANQDHKGIDRVISTSFYFSLVISVVLACLSMVMYWKIGDWFIIRPELVSTTRLLVLIVGLSFALIVPFQRSSAILSGLQRYDIKTMVEISLLLARTGLLVLLLRQGYGLLTMGLIFGGSEILIRLLQFFFSRRLLPNTSISIKDFDFRLLKDMAAYGTNTILYTMSAVILYKASDIMIGIFLGTSQISQFSIATAGVLLLTQFVQVFSSAIKPAVSDLDARFETDKVREISFLSQKYTLLMLIPAACFFIVMGSDFLKVWMSDRIQDPAILQQMGCILAIFTVAHGIRLTQYSNFIVLVGRGEHKMFGVFTLITAALFVIISVVCLKVFKMGLISVAWSNFVPVVLCSGILLQVYFNRKMQIRFKDTVSRVGIPAMLGTLPAIGLILIWKYVAAPDSWTKLVGVAITAAVATVVASWFLAFSKVERQYFLRIVVKYK